MAKTSKKLMFYMQNQLKSMSIISTVLSHSGNQEF